MLHPCNCQAITYKKNDMYKIMHVNSKAIQSPLSQTKICSKCQKKFHTLLISLRLSLRITTDDSMGSLLNFIYLKLNWSFSQVVPTLGSFFSQENAKINLPPLMYGSRKYPDPLLHIKVNSNIQLNFFQQQEKGVMSLH